MEQTKVRQNSITAFSIASLVFGALSLVTCCTGLLPLTMGGLGILFAVLSKRTGRPLPTMSRVGVILSVIGIVIGVLVTIWAFVSVIIPMLTDPQAREELTTFYQNYYGIDLEELLGDWDLSNFGF